MFKNIGGQFLTVYAVDYSTGAPKTGDANNITLYVSKDQGSVTAVSSNSGHPAEVDATNMPGVYRIALSMDETNADKLEFGGKSSTANVAVVPTVIYTRSYDLVSLVDKLETMLEADTGTGTGGHWQWSAEALSNVSDSAQAFADVLLARGVDNVEATMPQHCLGTLVLLGLEWSISGSTLTIKRTNGSTTHATKTLTTNAAADPITGVD